MPCTDGGVPYERADTAELREVSAILCGVLKAHGERILDTVDWKEAGIRRSEAIRWWEHHQTIDATRRANAARREREAREKAEALEKVRKTLTPSQLKALNLK